MSAATLVVTNDFPPRVGGIESFVESIVGMLGPNVVVLTRRETDAAATAKFDARQSYEIVRLPGPLLPTKAVSRTAAGLMRASGATRVVFGAAAPLGILAPALRSAGAETILALTHGHEVWWATLPGARSALRRIAADVDHLGVISRYTATRIAPALRPQDRTKLQFLPPPVDMTRFEPTVTDPGPVVLAAGRHVAQKGFVTLLDAWPAVREAVPDATLLIAGSGPQTPTLARRAESLAGVRLLGAIAHDDMPAFYRRARVFALLVRTRFAGLNPEGLGLVFCEAAASGLPVVVGRSGGAPETVIDGVSGQVVDPGDPVALAEAISTYLADPELARRAGSAGRNHIEKTFSAERLTATLRSLLGPAG